MPDEWPVYEPAFERIPIKKIGLYGKKPGNNSDR